ncbi:MAG: glutaredoxin family protein [Planctomycetales bacterium]|nr:glutaredoxin family protein [Planctomycetales bacterium]
MHVVLYTRERCCLCDDARQLLAKHGIIANEVDIDGDQTLCERFNTCVPVVEIDGRVRFRGRVDELLLRRLIDGENARATSRGEP